MLFRHGIGVLTAAVAITLTAIAPSAVASPVAGDLDTSYAAAGVASGPSIGGVQTIKYDVVKQLADGSTLAAGRSVSSDQYHMRRMVVTHFLADGSLDPNFGQGSGTQSIGGMGDHSQVYDMAVDPAGSIVLTGEMLVGGYSKFCVLKLTQTGQMDTSFGPNHDGYAVDGPSEGVSASIAVDSAGDYVVAGTYQYNGWGHIGVARFDGTTGALDTTFHGVGWDRYSLGAGNGSEVGGLAVDTDRNVYVVATNPQRDTAILKYDATGTLDTTFDTDGVATHAFTSDDRPEGVTIVGSKLVVYGTAFDGDLNSSAMFASRFDRATGAVDTTFGGGDGYVAAAPSDPFVIAYSMDSQADGRLVFAATNETGDGWVVRMNADGVLDDSFGNAGVVTFTGIPVYGVAASASGIYVAGTSAVTNGSGRVMRLLATTPAPPAPTTQPTPPAPTPPTQPTPSTPPVVDEPADATPTSIVVLVSGTTRKPVVAPKSGIVPAGNVTCGADELFCDVTSTLRSTRAITVPKVGKGVGRAKKPKGTKLTFGSVKMHLTSGQAGALSVKLSKAQIALLTKLKTVPVTATIKVTDSSGNVRVVTIKYVLKAPVKPSKKPIKH